MNGQLLTAIILGLPKFAQGDDVVLVGQVCESERLHSLKHDAASTKDVADALLALVINRPKRWYDGARVIDRVSGRL